MLNEYPVLELERVGERHLIPSRLDWRILLVLAQMGGWEPQHWLDYDGVYLQLPGVAISPREAFQIGKALEMILDDVPDFDIPLTGQIVPLEYFSGVRKQQIVKFAEFCKRGGFAVR